MAKRLLYITAGLIVVSLSASVSALLGSLAGEWGAKERRFSYEKDAIGPVLAADPAFARLEITMFTGDGSAYLIGEVPTVSDLDRLRARMRDLLGEVREIKPWDYVSAMDDPHDLASKRTLPAAEAPGRVEGSPGGPVR